MFHARLRSTRIYRGYTQQQLADELGIALRTYQNYEGGDREPALWMLAHMADLLNVPADYLLERDDYLKTLGISVDIPQLTPPKYTKPKRTGE